MKSPSNTELQIFVLFIIIYVCSAASAGVLAVENQVAFISCDAFTSAKKVPGAVTLIRWFHNLFHKPLYTLDLRPLNSALTNDTSFLNKGRHFPSPETEGRLYLDLNLDPIGLRIDPVLRDDAGEYTCRIDFSHWRSVLSSVELEVIIPPREAIIRDSTGQKCEGIIGPFLLGQTIRLTCDSLGGHPKSRTMWSNSIQSNHRVISKDSLLIIQSLQREDQWSHFTCSAQNSNMTAPKSVTVIIELILPPIDLHIESDSYLPFTAGQEVQLTCHCFGSYPKAHIEWLKQGEIMTAEERITDNGNKTTSFFKFIAHHNDDGKSVECHAINPEMKNASLLRAFPLRIHYKPEVSLAILSNKSYLSEGNNVSLLCNIKANPKASKVSWTFKDKEIHNSSSFLIKYNMLHIQHLTKNHSGKFACFATNNEGEGGEAVSIMIKHKPVCSENEISYRQERDVVNVTCNLASYPSDVTFYWRLHNSSSNHSWSSGQVSHTRVELQTSKSELLCWGRNEIGVQITPCKIPLIQGEKVSFAYLPIILIAVSGLVIFVIAIFIVIKKYKSRYKINSQPSETEMKEMKGANSIRLSTAKPIYGKFIKFNIISLWTTDKACDTVS